jgi:glycerophosphoryl diester phosphodiesterase
LSDGWDVNTCCNPRKTAVQIVSHRGIGSGFRENSLSAFSEVVARGASMIEVDLRCTLDGKLVLAHNKDMSAWGRPDVWIPMHRYEELQRITGDNDTTLDTFDAFVTCFPDTATILDIKWRGGMETLYTLHTYVRDRLDIHQFTRYHALLLWLPEHLATAQKLFPGIRIVHHRIDCIKAVARAMVGLKPAHAGSPRIVSIPAQCFRSEVLAQRLVERLRSPDHKLMIYLATRTDEVTLARSLYVDLLMTDNFNITQQLTLNAGYDSAVS